MADRQGVSDIKPVRSLSGELLTPPEISEEAKARLEANLAKAQNAYDADPNDEGNIVWLDRASVEGNCLGSRLVRAAHQVGGA